MSSSSFPVASVRFSGLSQWLSGKEPSCQYRRLKRCEFNPWVGKIPWSRKRQPTPVFMPGKVHGQRSLVDYSPWDRRKSDMTEHACMYMYSIMLSVKSDSFTFFSNLDSFYFFLWLPWLGLLKVCWLKVARVDILVLFMILEEMSMIFAIGLSYMAFMMLKYVPSMPPFQNLFFF